MGFKVDTVTAEFNLLMGRSQETAAALSRSLRNLQSQAGVAADAVDRLGRESTETAGQLRNTGNAAKKTGGVLNRLKGSVKGAIAAMLGFELARRVVVGAIRVFVGFRQEMNNVRAILNATQEDFERLSAVAQQLGRTTQFTARDAAGALTFLARTGLDTEEALGALPQVLNLAAAASIDLATAADISTNIMKGMGLEVEDLRGLVDVLAATTNSANVDMFELGEAMKIVAPVAAAAGQSVEETAALIGALGDAGIKGTLAGTSLRRMLINLQTGAGAAGRAIERLGLEVNDSEGNFVGLTEIIRQLEGRTISATDLFELFGARGIAAAQVLASRGADSIDEFTEALEKSGGTAKRMREQQLEGLPGVVLRIKSAFEGFAISTISILEPVLISIGNFIVDRLIPGFVGARTAVLLMGDSIILGFTLIRDVGGLAIQAILFGVARLIEGFGFLVRKMGEIGEVLGLEIGERLANAGLRFQRFGIEARRAAEGGMEEFRVKLGEDIANAGRIAGERLKEMSDEIDGTASRANKLTSELSSLVGKLQETASGATAVTIAAEAAINLTPFTAQLDELQARIREVFGFEGVGRLGTQEILEIQGQLREMTDEQREQAQNLIDAETDLRDLLDEIVELEQERADAGDDLAKIADLNRQIAELVGQIAETTIAADKAMEEFGTTSSKATGRLARDVAVALRGVNRIGDAFGFLNDDIRQAVDSALDLVGAIKSASAAGGALSIAGGIGIAGAAAGLLGGLLGGESAAAKAARESAEENTAALQRLTTEIGTIAEILGQTAGEVFAEAAAILAGELEGVLFDRFRVGVLFTKEELEALQAAGKAFGITIDAVKEVDGRFVVLREDVEALTAALNELDLTKLTETFSGAVDIMQQRLDLLDIEAPLDKFQKLLDIFLEFTDLPDELVARLRAIDTSTAAGRREFEALLLDIFDKVVAGELDVSALGGLTLDEFLKAVGDLEGFLDDIADEAGDTAGGVDNFVRDSRITVAQGSVLIAIMDSIRLLNRLQLDQLMILTGVAGPGVIAPPPSSAVTSAFSPVGTATAAGAGIIIQELNITVPVQSTDTEARISAREFGISTAEAIAARLQELTRRRSRGVGETM